MRCVALAALLLLAACDPVYVHQQHAGQTTYRNAARSAPHGSRPGDCAHDQRACPAPPLPYNAAEPHIPPLLPSWSAPAALSYD
jgi:hypothetical protein